MNSVILHIYLQNTSIMSMQSIMCAEETVLQLKLTHAPFIAEENQSDRFIFLQELRLLSDFNCAGGCDKYCPTDWSFYKNCVGGCDNDCSTELLSS